MEKQQRGRVGVMTPSFAGGLDPRWGSLDPDEWMGRVTLMEHSAYGQRYFPNHEVDNRLSRGWEIVEFVDPTKPIVPNVAATEPEPVYRVEHPEKRDDVEEAEPPKPPAPKKTYRRKSK